jgi:hypothetical protein
MATVTKTFRPVLGKMIRVTVLGPAGQVPAPATADASLATDGFVSVKLSSQIEEGSEIIQKKANGDLCINEMQPSNFKRLTLEIVLCGVNASLLAMISNVEPYYDDAGVVVGFTQPEGVIDEKFALELWTGLSGSDRVASGYFLLPYVNGGNIGDLEITEDGTIDFTVTAAFTKGGNSWGTGPYAVAEAAGTNAVQTLTVTGTPTGGTFRLRYGGHTTAPIAYNATAGTVANALNALPGIADGSFSATGGALPANPVLITFGGALGSEPQNLLTARTAFTGGTNPDASVATTTPGVDGAPSGLPAALDPLDHMLIMLTEILAPAGDDSPAVMPALP